MLRTFFSASLLLALIISLVSSMAIHYGHADVPVAASADEVQPLRAGDRAPHFVVETVDGLPFDFDPRRLERPTVLIVYRGGWCPYCNLYLSDMRKIVPEIRRMGADVLFLSGDRPDLLYQSLQTQTKADIDGLGYTILSDANAQASMALGISFRVPAGTVEYVNNRGDAYRESSMEKHGVLPVPAVFAIDSEGVIAFAHVNADYKVRLPADELLAAARRVATD